MVRDRLVKCLKREFLIVFLALGQLHNLGKSVFSCVFYRCRYDVACFLYELL